MNPPANSGDARDTGSIRGSGRSPGEGNGNPLMYSCLGNPVDRGAWQVIVHGVSKSCTQLSDWSPSPTGLTKGFTVGSAVKNLPANAGDLGLIPGSGRSSQEEKGNQLQHSCLENLMDRGAWWAIVHGVTNITPAAGLIKRAHTVHPLAV